MMDIEKLITGLSKEAYGSDVEELLLEAATALSTLQAENAQLRADLEYEREHANAYHEECGQWEAENEKLRADVVRFNDLLASYQNVLVPELRVENENLKERIEDTRLEWYAKGFGEVIAEVKRVRAELERVKRERDAIEQDFRAFTKQWWEEDSGFPCRWCKFENSGGCEWKAKHPNEEKICAGRAFEWSGQKED